jgi:hypothetical protein
MCLLALKNIIIDMGRIPHGRTQTITMSLRCFAAGDKKGIRVEYGRTTFERIFNFKCVTFERILPVVCLGNLISFP